MKKLHWTQTPAGKIKLSKALKKYYRTPAGKTRARRYKTPITPENSHGSALKETPTFAYALGHVESWIEHYAKSAGVSPELLTSELGEVLQLKAHR